MGMMDFSNTTVLYLEAEKKLDLQGVWHFGEEEIGKLGNANLELLSSDPSLQNKYWDFCWTLQSILEFQDLQANILPPSGRFLQQNYCFYEGLNVLREACLGGANSFMHISFAGFRSTLEFILAQCYWESLKHNELKFQKFYSWLDGKEGSLSFRKFVSLYRKYHNPPSELGLPKKIDEVYKKLCRYSHNPLMTESITSIRGSNLPVPSRELLFYWITIAHETVTAILQILIAAYPVCLFPVDILLKFGFNTPVGAFFDKYNAVPLKRALGEEKWTEFRRLFVKNENVVSRLKWYNSQADLSPSEILATLSDEDKKNLPEITSMVDEGNLLSSIVSIKAKMRATMLALTYWADAKMDNFNVTSYK